MFGSLSHSGPAQKKARQAGISRFIFILIALVIILAIIVTIPLILYYRSQSKAIGCYAALDTARRQAADKFIIDGFNNAEEVKEWVGYVMNGWDDLCPGGGNVYVVEDDDSEMPWRLVCGMHGEDKKECCRLNASWALDRVKEAVKEASDKGEPAPEKIELKLNGETLTVTFTKAETNLRRGTSSTSGYDGTVAFYSVAGDGGFTRETGAKAGAVCYFSFADPDNCANWYYGEGWTGTAYSIK